MTEKLKKKHKSIKIDKKILYKKIINDIIFLYKKDKGGILKC